MRREAASRRAESGCTVASLLLALMFVALPAQAQHTLPTAQAARPPSGIGGVVVGWAGLGFGVFNLATLPLCFMEFYPRKAKTLCMVSSGVLSAGGFIASAIGLSIGYPRRAEYRRWRAGRVAAQLDRLRVAPSREGALFSYALHF
jgi:hypothetical protein